MRRIVLAGLILALPGCAGPLGLFGSDPAQLREMVKVKDATALCVEGQYVLMAHARLVSVSVDKGITARVVVGEKCQMSVETVSPR